MDKDILLSHIDKVHTTELGINRIKRNLQYDDGDVVAYCKHKILDERCHIARRGKNWYCEIDGLIIIIHISSYTIITRTCDKVNSKWHDGKWDETYHPPSIQS